MWQYVLLIMLPIILQHVSLKRNTLIIGQKKQSEFSMKLFWLLLLVLLVFRHEIIGRDLPVYKYIFEYIANSNWGDALGRSPEIAWSFINKMISLFTNNFRWVIVLSALLATYHIGKAYITYTDDAALTIALYMNMSCFILLFSGLRQSIAISIGFLAFEYARQKKVIPFFTVVGIAMLFHTSAFMLTLIYPIYHITIKKNLLFFIVPLMILIYVFNQKVFLFLGNILKMFADYDTTITLTGSYTMLVLLILFAIFSFLIPEEHLLDDDTIAMRNYLLLAVILQMFAPLHSLAMRMNYYYLVFVPLLIPKIIKYRSVRWSQIAVVARYVMIIFFVSYFLITAPANNVLDTFPYYFFWETI